MYLECNKFHRTITYLYASLDALLRVLEELRAWRKSAEIRRNPQKSPSKAPKQYAEILSSHWILAFAKTPQAKTLAPTGDKIRVEGSRAQLAPTGRDFLGLPKT